MDRYVDLLKDGEEQAGRLRSQETIMDRYVDLLKAIGEPTRLRILGLLVASSGAELCCCEIGRTLAQPDYAVSRHLNVLKAAGLIRKRKEGRWVYVSASEKTEPFVGHLLRAVGSLGHTHQQMRGDLETLHKWLERRVDGRCVIGSHTP